MTTGRWPGGSRAPEVDAELERVARRHAQAKAKAPLAVFAYELVGGLLPLFLFAYYRAGWGGVVGAAVLVLAVLVLVVVWMRVTMRRRGRQRDRL